MSDFQKALLSTAVSIFVLSLVFITLLIPAIIIAIVAAIVYAAKGRRSIANGILAGIGLGLVAIGFTCFAGLFGQ
jgi:hypothetical protein